MKPTDKDKSGGTSFWGMFFSISLHVAVILLVLYWGFSGTSTNNGSNGPIEVSLSGIDTGGGQSEKPAVKTQEPPGEPKKAEPVKPEKKEEVKAPPPPEPEKKELPKEPEKKVEVKKEEPKKEPEKEEPKKKPEVKEPEKEVVKKEPEKKEIVPVEPEKKEEKKPEEPEKEVKKEVAKKPEPTEKPKTETKKTETAKKKDLESEKSKVIQDIQRQRVLENLKKGKDEGAVSQEEMGEEQRLAMADSSDIPEESEAGRSGSGGGGGGGSSVNPVLMQLYTNKVHRRISRNWRIPPGVPTDGSLESIVFFKVDESGRVYDVRVDKSSGNPSFDEYCVSAIYKSAPLPPAPSEFAEEAKKKGVLVPFRNELF